MSSLSHPLTLRDPTHLTTTINRRSIRRRSFRFQHRDLRIDLQPLRQSAIRLAFPYRGCGNPVSDRRRWNRKRWVMDGKFGGYGGVEDDEDGNDEYRSLDLLVRFVQNVFKKISKKARKAVRSVLPVSIPTELVCFSVDGVTILAFLWLAKAFLEVVCTVGSVVFISILVIRGIWSGIAYIRANRMNVLDQERLWNATRPAM
uniref:Uncharacterized protein n=1 Tax=Kalanchoe fedtschenkoi TaxID=63787 RepID=A0A7N0T0V9_KALFE